MTTTTALNTAIDDYELTSDQHGLVVKFEEGGVEVKIDRDALDDARLIPSDKADEHCGHDLDGAYEDGYESGTRNARNELERLNEGQAKVMEDWHNEHHTGVVRFCYEEPCKSLRTEAGA